jgi:hypothetical protein
MLLLLLHLVSDSGQEVFVGMDVWVAKQLLLL